MFISGFLFVSLWSRGFGWKEMAIIKDGSRSLMFLS